MLCPGHNIRLMLCPGNNIRTDYILKMQDYYKPGESLFFKDFKMECLSRSKLFKTDKNKILECINGFKSQFKKKRYFKQI